MGEGEWDHGVTCGWESESAERERVVVLFESLLLEEQNPLSRKAQTLGGCETRCVLSSLSFFSLSLSSSPLFLGFSNSSIWGLNPRFRFRFGFRASVSRFCLPRKTRSRDWLFIMATVASPADRILLCYANSLSCLSFLDLFYWIINWIRWIFFSETWFSGSEKGDLLGFGVLLADL